MKKDSNTPDKSKKTKVMAKKTAVKKPVKAKATAKKVSTAKSKPVQTKRTSAKKSVAVKKPETKSRINLKKARGEKMPSYKLDISSSLNRAPLPDFTTGKDQAPIYKQMRAEETKCCHAGHTHGKNGHSHVSAEHKHVDNVRHHRLH